MGAGGEGGLGTGGRNSVAHLQLYTLPGLPELPLNKPQTHLDDANRHANLSLQDGRQQVTDGIEVFPCDAGSVGPATRPHHLHMHISTTELHPSTIFY